MMGSTLDKVTQIFQTIFCLGLSTPYRALSAGVLCDEARRQEVYRLARKPDWSTESCPGHRLNS
jgi:hypothetical protein